MRNVVLSAYEGPLSEVMLKCKSIMIGWQKAALHASLSVADMQCTMTLRLAITYPELALVTHGTKFRSSHDHLQLVPDGGGTTAQSGATL